MSSSLLGRPVLGRQLRRALVPVEDRRLERQLARAAREHAEVQRRAQRTHDAVVRRDQRARQRARTGLPAQFILSGSGAAALLFGVVPSGVAVAVVGVSALLGARHLAALRRAPVAPLVLGDGAPAFAPPPPVSSAAFPAVRRLEVVRGELARLLPLVSPAGQQVAAETWAAAGQADAALRWQAARLAAVESHRGADRELMGPLYAGVQSQEAIVVAVADLVAASADPLAYSRLQDATDALYGLAQGLREVQGRRT